MYPMHIFYIIQYSLFRFSTMSQRRLSCIVSRCSCPQVASESVPPQNLHCKKRPFYKTFVYLSLLYPPLLRRPLYLPFFPRLLWMYSLWPMPFTSLFHYYGVESYPMKINAPLKRGWMFIMKRWNFFWNFDALQGGSEKKEMFDKFDFLTVIFLLFLQQKTGAWIRPYLRKAWTRPGCVTLLCSCSVSAFLFFLGFTPLFSRRSPLPLIFLCTLSLLLQGREFTLNGSPYELYSCDTCGQKGVHIGEYRFLLPFEFYLKSWKR